jgi:hypothetical protein
MPWYTEHTCPCGRHDEVELDVKERAKDINLLTIGEQLTLVEWLLREQPQLVFDEMETYSRVDTPFRNKLRDFLDEIRPYL